MRFDAHPDPWPLLLRDFARHEAHVLGLAAATIGNHNVYLRAFATYWCAAHGSRDLAEARAGEVTDFLDREAARGMQASTRLSELAALRRFFDWLMHTERAERNPARAVPAPRQRPAKIEVYRPADVAAILAHTSTLSDVRGRQRHAAVAMLRYTGMRSGELRTLPVDAIELDHGRAEVLSKKLHRRSVLLPAPLVAILRSFLAEVRPRLPASPLLFANGHKFVTTPQSGLSHEALAREVELAGEGAGIPGRHHPHRWRHTFATELLRAGVDVHTVQRLLGHISISSTVHYAHLAVDDLRGAVDELFAGEWPATYVTRWTE